MANPNFNSKCREQVRAFITLAAESAGGLLRIGRIKIGWIQAKIRPWVSEKRCFQCLIVDHRTASCMGPDRTTLCLKYGEASYRIRECANIAKCFLCRAQAFGPFSWF